ARRAFTIPMELSRQDKDLLELDSVSIRDFLDASGLRSPALHWYVNYACRDDFGCTSGDVSAWAGIHYFSSRDTDQNSVLTWPEGNGWIVKRLRERLRNSIRPSALVFRVTQDRVDYYDIHQKT